MEDSATRCLSPLPECSTAVMVLRDLGVDADVPVGWAPACLALVIRMQSVRPGVRVRLRVTRGSLRMDLSGGIVLSDDGGIDEQMATWFMVDAIAGLTCPRCGRPGRPHPDDQPDAHKPKVLCDACRYLADGPASAELPFLPRLPLPDETLDAISDLESRDPERFASIPAGWARLVLGTVRDMPASALASIANFEIDHDHASLSLPPEAWTSGLRELNERLEVNSRVLCRSCSRRIANEPEHGEHGAVCGGCRWVQFRGWKIVSAASLGIDDD